MKKNKLIILIAVIISLGFVLLNTKKLDYANGDNFIEKVYPVTEIVKFDEEESKFTLRVSDEDFKNKKTVSIDINKDVDRFIDDSYERKIVVRDIEMVKGIQIFNKEIVFKRYFRHYDTSLYLDINTELLSDDYLASDDYIVRERN